MAFISGLFAILTLVFFILIILGLIKPSIVKMPSRGKAFLVFFSAMIVSSIIFSATQSDEDKARYAAQNQKSETQAMPADNQQANTQEAVAQTESKQVEQTQDEVEPQIGLTNSQKNAVRSAEQYLSISGFSRNGLINQLSASAGDGYNKADATVAVDSLDVDWNEQAVKSAKQYLEIQGFSCNGLIQQLSSGAGDKYTVQQATYGAKQAGAC